MTLLNQPFPPIKRIRELLTVIAPGEVAEVLKSEPNASFQLDYYLRLFEPEIGGRIISHPDFTMEALIELFNCQMIRFYGKHLDESSEIAITDDVLLDSFWKELRKEKLLRLFKELITTGKSNIVAAYMLLKSMNQKDMEYIGKTHAVSILDFFKRTKNNFESFLLNNLELYDFIYKLAREQNDTEYLEFLKQYTRLAMSLRMAQNYADEAEMSNLTPEGTIPLKELVNIIQDAPNETFELTLNILVQRGLVGEGIKNGLLRLKKL